MRRKEEQINAVSKIEEKFYLFGKSFLSDVNKRNIKKKIIFIKTTAIMRKILHFFLQRNLWALKGLMKNQILRDEFLPFEFRDTSY